MHLHLVYVMFMHIFTLIIPVQKAMTAETKNHIEKVMLEAFREAYDDFPKGKLTQSESPDFILQLNPGRTIGIEISSLGNGLPATKVIRPEDFIGLLNRIILVKENKLRVYKRRRLNFYWLVITFNSSQAMISNNLRERLADLVPGSDYQKIFLFDYPLKDIIIVK